jgi:hypothetical protein
MAKRKIPKGKTVRKGLKETKRRKTSRRAAPGRRRQARQKVNITIRRSSGRIERFNPDRMAQTISRSGTPFLVAREVAKTVSREVSQESSAIAKTVENAKMHRKSQVARTIQVDGQGLRRRVAEELVRRNRSDAARAYVGNKPENSTAATNAVGKDMIGRSRQPRSKSQAAKRSKLVYDSTTQYAKH